MLPKTLLATVGLAGLLAACALQAACVADRPSRNGVFDENQYLRKDFLVSTDASKPDEGWFVKSTILRTSTPNVLGPVSGAGLFAGAVGQSANLVRFRVSQDTLAIVDMREINNDPVNAAQGQRTPEVVNAWPITNVDLKYRVNLDGEKTNYYEENQELDWQVRQWVKLNFAKNDLSDLFAFGAEDNPIIQKCTDAVNASATLDTGSFLVDEANGYFEFALDVTVPISIPADSAGATGTTDADTCLAAFGNTWQTFQAMGRQNVTFVLKTAFVRPSKVVDGSYVPMPIAEKDPIHHKYGAFETIPAFRDPVTGLLAADQYVSRHNPNEPIVYYFAPGAPEPYRKFFLGLVAQTNAAVLVKTGARARLQVLDYDDATTYKDGAGPVRRVGDPRYSFIVWHSDLDNGSGLLGVAQPFIDPRTGEIVSADVNVFEGPFQDTVEQRLDLFLKTVGAEYLTPSGDFDDKNHPPPANCKTGQTIPLVPGDVAATLNQQSTVYSKIQQYLQRPFAQYGYLGPSDFVPPHDPDFLNAYFAVLPYQVYADPQANPFVNPEGSTFQAAQQMQWKALQHVAAFDAIASEIDHGQVQPFTSPAEAAAFGDVWEGLSEQVNTYSHTQAYLPGMNAADDISLFSYFDIYQRDGRHCIDGQWESRATYVTNLIQSLNMATAAHEFGHSLGLRHNFMGSVDQRNFPLDGAGKPLMYSSSIMDYNLPTVEAFYETTAATPVWGPYDQAALGWIYGNSLDPSKVGPDKGAGIGAGISGQISATAPWNDPLGFKAGAETTFLYCSDEHTRYTPLCRPYDAGVTPAEIVSNQIQQREWNYLWTNFRLYHKYFSLQNYGQQVVNDFAELRRFQSMWIFDWSQAELTNDLRLIGVPVPAGATAGDYYTQLFNKFETDMSVANQLAVGYQRAIIDQSSGQRPFVTIFDPYYGDTTQQGIQIDKVTLTTTVPALWPAVSNFDPTQAAGVFVATLGGQFGDPAYRTVADSTLNDFLGASFATFQYTQLGPLATFAQATHDPAYAGNLAYQNWIGAQSFTRDPDFLTYVRAIAVKNGFANCDEVGQNCKPCTDESTCTWDPRTPQVTTTQLTQSDRVNRFVGPDGRTYIWGYLANRNEWILADKDFNTAMYALMLNWTTDVVYGEDTGPNGANRLEYPVRFALDSFQYFNEQQPGSTGTGGTASAPGMGN